MSRTFFLREFENRVRRIGRATASFARSSSDGGPRGQSIVHRAFRLSIANTRWLGGRLIRRSLSVWHRAPEWLWHLGVAPSDRKSPAVSSEHLPRRAERAGGTRVPSHRCFRVLFIVIPGITEAICMRYRAYNVMEALRSVGVETEHLYDRLFPERLHEVLAFDLIVLVRHRWSPEIALLIEFAERHSIPVICDLDDYLFDEEVLPHSEWLRQQPIETAQSVINQFRDLVLRCRYYTGTTSYLRERAAALGVSSHRIPNGLNTAQIEMSRIALEQVDQANSKPGLRLGYFSGTLTHQSDFGMIAPAIHRLLAEFPTLSFVISGDFNLAEFPEFSAFADRVDRRRVDWTRLPAEIARVDINLIPLVLSPFTEAKSDLKYYEAAVLEVPSVASPTAVFRACITHGSNGFLAHSPDDWYTNLRMLIVDHGLRRQMGSNAYRHALKHYSPEVIGEHAVAVYQDILLDHRRRLGVPDDAPTILVLFGDLWRALRDGSPALTLCRELAKAGARVTLQIDEEPIGLGADQLECAVAGFLGEATELTYQVGGEILCADILLATDSSTAFRAWESKSRAKWAAYLVSEYEPAHLAEGPARDRAIASYELGMDLLVLDPAVTDLLAKPRHSKITVLPTWIEVQPAEFNGCLDPKTVFFVSSSTGLPDDAWTEAAWALERVRADHPDLGIVVGGGAAARGEATGMDVPVIPQIDGEAFNLLLAQRPICVLLCPSGRPPRVLDMAASGCPVIVVRMRGEPVRRDVELTQGVIEVQAKGLDIARAIDSLLVDRVRLSSLTVHAAEHVRRLPPPVAAARALIEDFRSTCGADLNPRHRDGPSTLDPTSRLVASSGIRGERRLRACSESNPEPNVTDRRAG
jgi:glycosyltransferase involved in cell wall biosynthesis